jgi:hypothetical protein
MVGPATNGTPCESTQAWPSSQSDPRKQIVLQRCSDELHGSIGVDGQPTASNSNPPATNPAPNLHVL